MRPLPGPAGPRDSQSPGDLGEQGGREEPCHPPQGQEWGEGSTCRTAPAATCSCPRPTGDSPSLACWLGPKLLPARVRMLPQPQGRPLGPGCAEVGGQSPLPQHRGVELSQGMLRVPAGPVLGVSGLPPHSPMSLWALMSWDSGPHLCPLPAS